MCSAVARCEAGYDDAMVSLRRILCGWAPMIGVVVVLAIFALPAIAQQRQTVSPPTPGKPDDPPYVMNILTMIVIAGLILGAAFMPSKRGHQD